MGVAPAAGEQEGEMSDRMATFSVTAICDACGLVLFDSAVGGTVRPDNALFQLAGDMEMHARECEDDDPTSEAR